MIVVITEFSKSEEIYGEKNMSIVNEKSVFVDFIEIIEMLYCN